MCVILSVCCVLHPYLEPGRAQACSSPTFLPLLCALCYKKYLRFPRLIIFPPQSLPDVGPVVPVPMATEVPAAAVPFCGACPGSWHAAGPRGWGESVCQAGEFQGVPADPPLRWPPGSSWGASPPGSCLASRPQHLAHRTARSRNRLLKVHEVPLLCEAPTQRVPEGWDLGCLESSRGRGKKVPTKGLVDVTILVSPVCWSKLGGDGEIELARGEGSRAAV